MKEDVLALLTAIVGAIVTIVFAFIARNRKKSKEEKSLDLKKETEDA